MENFDNSVPTFDRLPAFVLGPSQKIDGIEKKIDMLLSAPIDGSIDRQELLNIKQASELIVKTLGTIYTLTSDNKISFSKRGNIVAFAIRPLSFTSVNYLHTDPRPSILHVYTHL